MFSNEGFRSVGIDQDESDNEGDAEGETAVQQAWGELADIEREQERWSQLRTHIEQKLEICRQRGVALEDVITSRITIVLIKIYLEFRKLQVYEKDVNY